MDENNTNTTKPAPVGADDMIDLIAAHRCRATAVENLMKCVAAFVSKPDNDFRSLLIRSAENLAAADEHLGNVRKDIADRLNDDVTLKP